MSDYDDNVEYSEAESAAIDDVAPNLHQEALVRPQQIAPPTKFVRKFLDEVQEHETREEFLCIDYTPIITHTPIDMFELIRPQRLGRRIKVFISVTCYNEEGDELHNTLNGIASNMILLEKAGLNWTEVLVAVVFDGREKMHPSMVEYLQYGLKVYDPDLVKDEHMGKRVNMHCFERSVELPKNIQQREYHYPLQILIACKERNGGKLNSHLWMFNGFAVQLNPKYIFLFDVGTVPREDAILKLFTFLEENPTCGGACGEITIRNVRYHNVLDAAQFFEYKVSHVLDKSFESALGYISVLPGAFSAYRWMAIRGEPLAAYFTIEQIATKDLGPFTANMYLAEDRILCFEILARKHSIWTLEYIAGAVSETDCPQHLVELIKQRRRWLNGSFFSLVYYLTYFPRFLYTDHSLVRKVGFVFQFCNSLTTAILAWFNIGSLFLSLCLIFFSGAAMIGFGVTEVRWGFSVGYFLMLFMQIILGLVGKVGHHSGIYSGIFLSYGLLMFFALFIGFVVIATAPISPFVSIGILCSMCAYPLAALIHGEIRGVIATFFQYYFALPTFMNMFTIYSYCNLHDISWGTKSGNLQSETRRAHEEDVKTLLKKAEQARAMIAKLDADSLKKMLIESGVKLPETDPKIVELRKRREKAKKKAKKRARRAKEKKAILKKLRQRKTEEKRRRGSKVSGEIGGVAEYLEIMRETDPDRMLLQGVPNESKPEDVLKRMGYSADSRDDSDIDFEEEDALDAELAGMSAGELNELEMQLEKEALDGNFSSDESDSDNENVEDDGEVYETMEEALAAEEERIQKDYLQQLLDETRKVAERNEQHARRAQKAADSLVLDKAHMAEVFNDFRIMMLSAWLLTNALYIVIVLTYDPNLIAFSKIVTILIIYAVMFKMIGSVYYLLRRSASKIGKKYFPTFYRVEEGYNGEERIVFCLRPADYHYYDDLWLAEHEQSDAAREELNPPDDEEEEEVEYVDPYVDMPNFNNFGSNLNINTNFPQPLDLAVPILPEVPILQDIPPSPELPVISTHSSLNQLPLELAVSIPENLDIEPYVEASTAPSYHTPDHVNVEIVEDKQSLAESLDPSLDHEDVGFDDDDFDIPVGGIEFDRPISPNSDHGSRYTNGAPDVAIDSGSEDGTHITSYSQRKGTGASSHFPRGNGPAYGARINSKGSLGDLTDDTRPHVRDGGRAAARRSSIPSTTSKMAFNSSFQSEDDSDAQPESASTPASVSLRPPRAQRRSSMTQNSPFTPTPVVPKVIEPVESARPNNQVRPPSAGGTSSAKKFTPMASPSKSLLFDIPDDGSLSSFQNSTYFGPSVAPSAAFLSSFAGIQQGRGSEQTKRGLEKDKEKASTEPVVVIPRGRKKRHGDHEEDIYCSSVSASPVGASPLTAFSPVFDRDRERDHGAATVSDPSHHKSTRLQDRDLTEVHPRTAQLVEQDLPEPHWNHSSTGTALANAHTSPPHFSTDAEGHILLAKPVRRKLTAPGKAAHGSLAPGAIVDTTPTAAAGGTGLHSGAHKFPLRNTFPGAMDLVRSGRSPRASDLVNVNRSLSHTFPTGSSTPSSVVEIEVKAPSSTRQHAIQLSRPRGRTFGASAFTPTALQTQHPPFTLNAKGHVLRTSTSSESPTGSGASPLSMGASPLVSPVDGLTPRSDASISPRGLPASSLSGGVLRQLSPRAGHSISPRAIHSALPVSPPQRANVSASTNYYPSSSVDPNARSYSNSNLEAPVQPRAFETQPPKFMALLKSQSASGSTMTNEHHGITSQSQQSHSQQPSETNSKDTKTTSTSSRMAFAPKLSFAHPQASDAPEGKPRAPSVSALSEGETVSSGSSVQLVSTADLELVPTDSGDLRRSNTFHSATSVDDGSIVEVAFNEHGEFDLGLQSDPRNSKLESGNSQEPHPLITATSHQPNGTSFRGGVGLPLVQRVGGVQKPSLSTAAHDSAVKVRRSSHTNELLDGSNIELREALEDAQKFANELVRKHSQGSLRRTSDASSKVPAFPAASPPLMSPESAKADLHTMNRGTPEDVHAQLSEDADENVEEDETVDVDNDFSAIRIDTTQQGDGWKLLSPVMENDDEDDYESRMSLSSSRGSGIKSPFTVTSPGQRGGLQGLAIRNRRRNSIESQGRKSQKGHPSPSPGSQLHSAGVTSSVPNAAMYDDMGSNFDLNLSPSVLGSDEERFYTNSRNSFSSHDGGQPLSSRSQANTITSSHSPIFELKPFESGHSHFLGPIPTLKGPRSYSQEIDSESMLHPDYIELRPSRVDDRNSRMNIIMESNSVVNDQSTVAETDDMESTIDIGVYSAIEASNSRAIHHVPELSGSRRLSLPLMIDSPSGDFANRSRFKNQSNGFVTDATDDSPLALYSESVSTGTPSQHTRYAYHLNEDQKSPADDSVIDIDAQSNLSPADLWFHSKSRLANNQSNEAPLSGENGQSISSLSSYADDDDGVDLLDLIEEAEEQERTIATRKF